MTKYFSAIAGNQRVDADSGVIHGVSIITVGKAKGHGVSIDKTTLEQVKACAEGFTDGVKVKIDHGTGFSAIAGTIKNFSIDGDQLRADFHLLKTHPDYSRIIEMAQTLPESFGFSISFSMKREEIGGVNFARCEDLYSADLVEQPAANPGGLFSAKVDLNPITKTMLEEIKTLWKALGEKLNGTPEPAELSEIKTGITDLGAKIEGELTQLKADLATSKQTISTLQTSLEKAQNEVNASATSLTNFNAKLNEAVTALNLSEIKPDATSEQKIVALQTAVTSTLAKLQVDPGTVPAAPAAVSKRKVSRAEFSALSPVEKMNFCKSGGIVE